jgi:hypothetical protein
MTADTFRLVWTSIVIYCLGTSAPAVMLGGASWGKALASTITSIMLGALIFACMWGAIAMLHAVWSGARTRIASYRNA